MTPEDRAHYQDCVSILAAIFEDGQPIHRITTSYLLRAIWMYLYRREYPQR